MLSNVMRLSPSFAPIYRNSGRLLSTTPVTSQSDPIQKLFVDKIREYNQKAKSTADGLVDANERVMKGLKEDMDRVARSYNIKDENNLSNLNLKFDAEIKLDSINLKD
ncbi:ATP synthase-coupling factor 6, mitochondrial-like [Oppia nitens]|uniref:ATP synthase-coupling factor 6, mitochondrial-like n=1 Tax=Oppia nitens TaxID=1686743 RepID=UPI0023DC082B|nr:ATP synthase-coupling factor 6, mitochondrial-like [Oppia nitens]